MTMVRRLSLVVCLVASAACGSTSTPDSPDAPVGGPDGATPCTDGETRACYTGDDLTRGVGECTDGVETCTAGSFGACTGEVLPDTETCDGLDNDCDGTIDNGCDCIVGTTQPCYGGPAPTENVGPCVGGTQTCEATGWGDCVGDVLPAPETCDNVDEDCDGTLNNGNPGGGVACSTGVPGLCDLGSTDCTGGAIVCTQTVMPAPETCDGLDNNCDGSSDEGNPGSGMACMTGVPGICATGATNCSGGAIVCSQTVMPVAESCDGLDNDCDGMTDNGNPGGGFSCSTGLLGECNAGVTACQAGGVVCNQTVMAAPETCDGLDNDCDGTVDQGNPGGGAACATGLPGVCSAGTLACVAGSVQCTQNVAASPEACDGLDNDCDGAVDQGNPGGGLACSTGLPGVCNNGTTSCTTGAIVCNQTTMPSAETCDGLDNDCSGAIDNGAAPVTPVVYFRDTFADNSAGWTFDTTWGIGSATASSGQSYGGPDPAADHTASTNNGVAGANIGGNVPTAVHGFYYLTSPVFDATAFSGRVYLQFWRWLNSDYTPYMANRVEVYDGTTWVVLFASGGSPGVQDAAWTKLNYDLTAYKNAAMQVRFGYDTGSGVFTVSGWNIDDVVLSNQPDYVPYLVDDFADNGLGWTLDATWSIGSATVSSGQGLGSPDPGADHTPTADNGVVGVVIGGNYGTALVPFRYMTSPVMDTSAAVGSLYFEYWRWLNSDYPAYATNVVQVFSGGVWTTVWTGPASTFITDSAWQQVVLDLTAYKSATMQIRIGYTIGSGGVVNMSGWNVDDVKITASPVCM